MSPDEFEKVMETAIANLPDTFRERLDNIAFLVEDWPDDETCREMELESKYDLLGLYRGWPLTERGTEYAGVLPDTVYLYRKPILDWCRAYDEPVADCIVDTVIHEIGHYYGLSDAEMERIEAECHWEGGAPPPREDGWSAG